MSVSLSVEDVEFLDAYTTAHELRSRSAAVQSAVSALRLAELAGAYDEAWDEWDRGEDSALWAMTVEDGI